MSRGNVAHSYEYMPNYSTAAQHILPERFILKIRQQPIQTRLSTSNERDRRPLDPPPIVQIELENSNAQETQDFLQNPYLFMCASLVHANTHEDVNNATQNTLSGQSSSSMYKLKDINNQDGGFFVFGDLSVKLEGQFRLKFSMFEISNYGVTNLKSIYSNTFQVYSSKSFPGMLESTFLSRSFSDQGVRIRIRKEHRVQMTGSRKRKLSSHDGTLDDERKGYYTEKPVHHLQSPWQPSSDYPDHRRGSNATAMSGGSRRSSYHHPIPHLDRKPTVPFSPPHQSYDHYRLGHGEQQHFYCDKTQLHQFYNHPQHYYQDSNIPSPPQSSLFKLDVNRRLSLDDKLPMRRQSADSYHLPSALQHQQNVPRRLSLQQHSRMTQQQQQRQHQHQHQHQHQNQHQQQYPPNHNQMIHLPPLRSVVPNNSFTFHPSKDNIVEVDAAVAMMQLASRQSKQSSHTEVKANRSPFGYST